jgi:hypothetical protein
MLLVVRSVYCAFGKLRKVSSSAPPFLKALGHAPLLLCSLEGGPGRPGVLTLVA